METVQEMEVIAMGGNVQNVNIQTNTDDCIISAENEKLIAGFRLMGDDSGTCE